MLEYKMDEDKYFDLIKDYINKTYTEHYSNSKYQTIDLIIDSGHGQSFCMGNILKYATRFGKKQGKNRSDLLKIIHYAIIMLSLLDKEDSEKHH